MQKVNLRDALASLTEQWSQKVVAEANGSLFKVAKGKGQLNWHKHGDQDELFLIQKGRLVIELRDRTVELGEGDLFVVPKGVEHRPFAREDVEFLIVGLGITSNEAGGRPDDVER